MENNNIELRSEEIQELIAKVPNWLLRWGIFIIAIVLLMLGIASWFIQYPDIIMAPLKLTSTDAPKALQARTDGKLIKLLANDKAKVQNGQIVAHIEATANHQEVLELEKNLEIDTVQYQNLGELQSAYQTYNQAFIQYQSFKNENYLAKRKALLEKDLIDLKRQTKNILEQLEIQKEDLQLAENEYLTQKKLLAQKVIASLEFKREESKYINKKLPIKNLESSLIANSTAQTAKQKEIMDLEKTISEQENIYLQAKNSMKAAIEAWKQRFLIIASADGILQFAGIIQEKMAIANNQTLFYVSSENQKYFGTVMIPQENFGKVKIGQKVLIKFNSYPFQEFGMVEGKIENIALIPTSTINVETYMAKVIFTKGLITNFNKKIIYHEGMAAGAEIITEDLRLFERLFYQLRKALAR